MIINMKQYCRSCATAVAQDDDEAYCEAKNTMLSKARCNRLNLCKAFSFNELDAFDLNKVYKPRQKQKPAAALHEDRQGEQLKL